MDLTTSAPCRVRDKWQTMGAAGRASLALALVLIAMAAIVTSLWSLTWSPAVFLAQIVTLESLGWGDESAIVTGALLLLMAPAVARGKRHAWGLLLVVLGMSLLSAGIHLGPHGHSWFLLWLLLAVLLAAPLFSARSDPRALRRGYIALALSIGCLVAFRLVLQTWHPTALGSLRVVPGLVVLIGPRQEPMRDALWLGLHVLLVICLGYGIVEVLRPVLTAGRLRGDERQRAVEIVRRSAQTTTAHYALGADKSYYWSPSGQSLLAYRLVGGVALILGDPVGAEAELAPLVLAFLAYARQQDWMVADYLASSMSQRRWRGWGLPAIKIGEEAIIDVAEFSTQGKAGAPVRHSLTRARRDGVVVRCWQDEPVPEAIFAGMRQVSEAWLGERGRGQQMGFSMGRFPADWSPRLLTAAALDAHGEVQALLTWTPLYAGNGWALDIMRRSRATTPGTMELLIAESIAWARERGYARMTLGLAPLAGLDERTELHAAVGEISWLERGAGYLHRRRLLLGDYVTLYRFKAKFQPRWEARYLLLSDRRALPQVVAALMRALGYSGMGMLRDVLVDLLPRVGQRGSGQPRTPSGSDDGAAETDPRTREPTSGAAAPLAGSRA